MTMTFKRSDALHLMDNLCNLAVHGRLSGRCACGQPARWHNNFGENRSARFQESLCDGCATELFILLALK